LPTILKGGDGLRYGVELPTILKGGDGLRYGVELPTILKGGDGVELLNILKGGVRGTLVPRLRGERWRRWLGRRCRFARGW